MIYILHIVSEKNVLIFDMIKLYRKEMKQWTIVKIFSIFHGSFEHKNAYTREQAIPSVISTLNCFLDRMNFIDALFLIYYTFPTPYINDPIILCFYRQTQHMRVFRN
jgi:hypothetical protein